MIILFNIIDQLDNVQIGDINVFKQRIPFKERLRIKGVFFSASLISAGSTLWRVFTVLPAIVSLALVDC